MDSNNLRAAAAAKGDAYSSHMVATPYPSRGHINPMLNLCKLIASRNPKILVTFVVTEEWLSLIGFDGFPGNLKFSTIPNNIIPPEKDQLDNGITFALAVMTKLEAPFERILDRLNPPATAMVTDALLQWAVNTGNRRKIPVAALSTSSQATFSIFYHSDLFKKKLFPLDLEEHADDVIDFIPGIPSIRVADIPDVLLNNKYPVHPRIFQDPVAKSQYLLSVSIYELEPEVFDANRAKFSIPIYSVGPLIPFQSSSITSSRRQDLPHYIQWLNSQPKSSVLYISMGSGFKVSSAQLDEMIAGVKASGVSCFWVGRDDMTSRLQDHFSDVGLVVPWCDQLRVLSHPSVGGFLTHCGWSSVLEAAFSRVPMLTFPIFGDQFPNSKQIAEDWKNGWRLKKGGAGSEVVTKREEITETVQRFMDGNSSARIELIEGAKKVENILKGALEKGGSSDTNLDAFIKDITQA